MEEDEEEAIALLAIAEVPDMPMYLARNLQLVKAHLQAITDDDGDAILPQLKQRETALRWYLKHYQRLALEPAMDAEFLVDPTFGGFEDMDVDEGLVVLRK